jgi:hypothetical protein
VRSASFIAVGACLAIFAWRVGHAHHEWDDEGWFLVAAPSVLVAAVAVVLCVAVALVLRFSGSAARGRASTWCAMAIAVALVVATPIGFDYDDGCNDHTTVAPLGAVPLMALIRPSRAGASYVDASTLVACPGM